MRLKEYLEGSEMANADNNGMFVRGSSLRTWLAVGSAIGAIVSVGGTWKLSDYKIGQNQIEIQKLSKTIDAIKDERARDYEILIRIDERLKRIEASISRNPFSPTP